MKGETGDVRLAGKCKRLQLFLRCIFISCYKAAAAPRPTDFNATDFNDLSHKGVTYL